MEESVARRWNEWDRHGRKAAMALVLPNDCSLRISASLHDYGVAYLEAGISQSVLEITDIFVQEEIRANGRSFGGNRVVPGRKSGYGTLLIRALIAFARSNPIVEIRGIVTDRQLAETPELLEWFSKRGFIVDSTFRCAGSPPGVIARIRMPV